MNRVHGSAVCAMEGISYQTISETDQEKIRKAFTVEGTAGILAFETSLPHPSGHHIPSTALYLVDPESLGLLAVTIESVVNAYAPADKDLFSQGHASAKMQAAEEALGKQEIEYADVLKDVQRMKDRHPELAEQIDALMAIAESVRASIFNATEPDPADRDTADTADEQAAYVAKCFAGDVDPTTGAVDNATRDAAPAPAPAPAPE